MSPRISVVMSGGNIAYTRDGQVFEHGLLGGGVVDAVEGDAEASEAAETYHNRTIGSIVSEGVGILCFSAGVGAATVRAGQDKALDASTSALLLCGLAGTIVGAVLLVTAQPYQWDAINIYNDHVNARLTPYWPPPGTLPTPAFRPPMFPTPPPTSVPSAPMPAPVPPAAPVPAPTSSSSGALPNAPPAASPTP